MAEGEFFKPLDCYIMIERSGNKIVRIFFSPESPSGHSEIAEGIIRHVVEGAPCPEVELDFSGLTEFQRKVISAVRSIPRGQTRTYGEVAAQAGSPGAARAVGQVMASNPFAIIMPCHRVVSRNGLGGYAWGVDVKRRLLEIEAL